MPVLRLLVRDVTGEREVTIDRSPYTLGRREGNDLRLPGGEVSRDHAEIVTEGSRLILKDRSSRYGTFVNDEAVTTCDIRPGDLIRLGRGGGAEIVVVDEAGSAVARTGAAARDDLRQIAALLDGVRALGSGRVLQDVLALVLDASLDVSSA